MTEIETGEQPLTEGSPLEKFASVGELEEAYINLEKEFTRKSQLLSDFQKMSEQKENNLSASLNKDIESQNKEMEDGTQTLPWQQEDWNKQVEDFLAENPLASKHAKEISKIVLEDKALLQSKRPLYSAWAKWLETNYKTPQQLLEDSNFLEQVQRNEKVRRGVIKDYVSQLNEREISPPLFAKSEGAGGLENKKQTPKSLDEVRELAKKIFSK